MTDKPNETETRDPKDITTEEWLEYYRKLQDSHEKATARIKQLETNIREAHRNSELTFNQARAILYMPSEAELGLK